MPTAKELGEKMAQTLLLELDVSPEVTPPSGAFNIIDVQTYYGSFFKFDKNKTTFEVTKEALLKEMFNDRKSAIAFCCVSLQTDTKLTFDIDHVFPREIITKKQLLLLDYLNKSGNEVLAKAFMGEDPLNSKMKNDIGKYFKRDPGDNNKIKATRWFVDVCYNNLSNLFHLKHYLNRGKSASTPQKWFEQNFPQKFRDDLKLNGGINEGVIMQQIFHLTNLISVPLGKMKNKDGKEIGEDIIIYLHERKGIGLGEFIRKWFKNNPTTMGQSKEIQEINTKLIEMLESNLKDYGKEKGLKKFLSTINMALKVAENRDTLHKESSEDSDEAVDARRNISYKAILKAFDFMHSVKKIKKQVLSIVNFNSKDAVKEKFYDLCIDYFFELKTKEREEALNYLQKQCNILSQKGVLLTEEEVKKLLLESQQEGDFELKFKKEQKAKEVLEKENEELKKLLQEKGKRPASEQPEESIPNKKKLGSPHP